MTVVINMVNGVKTKVVRQSELTGECWSIQFWGIEACEKCEAKGTLECGGERIIKEIEAGRFPIDGLPDQRGDK